MGCCGLCFKTLADAAYFIKHNLQVGQPNASPCYPCAVGKGNTALCTSGSVNHDSWAAYTDPAEKWVANLSAHLRTSQMRCLSSVSDQCPASWCPANTAESEEPSIQLKATTETVLWHTSITKPKRKEERIGLKTTDFGIPVQCEYPCKQSLHTALKHFF